MQHLQLVEATEAHAIATTPAMVLAVFRSRVALEAVERQIALQRELLLQRAPVGLVNVMEAGCQQMDGKVRDVIAKWTKEPDATGIRPVNVLEGDEIGIRIARTLLRAIALNTPKQSRPHFFGDYEEAAHWLATQLEGAASPREIIAHINTLRAQIR